MLDEKKSDEGRVLQQYRKWLLSNDLIDLLNFHYLYAVQVMQHLTSKSERVKLFSVDYLNLLLTKSYSGGYPMLSEIVNDKGFLSVARAIRNCTIYAERARRSEQQQKPQREVRYALAQQWKQKIHGGNAELASAIAEFVQDQNWEVIHKLEDKYHKVSTGELNSLMALIEKYGTELVGSLLLAYGYSEMPKSAKRASSEDESEEPDGEASSAMEALAGEFSEEEIK